MNIHEAYCADHVLVVAPEGRPLDPRRDDVVRVEDLGVDDGQKMQVSSMVFCFCSRSAESTTKPTEELNEVNDSATQGLGDGGRRRRPRRQRPPTARRPVAALAPPAKLGKKKTPLQNAIKTR